MVPRKVVHAKQALLDMEHIRQRRFGNRHRMARPGLFDEHVEKSISIPESTSIELSARVLTNAFASVNSRQAIHYDIRIAALFPFETRSL